MDDFSQRVVIGLTIYGIYDVVGDYTKKLAKGTEIQTTNHGAERIAGQNATRGGVLSTSEIMQTNSFGKKLTQANGAIVKVYEIGGRFNITVTGDRGLITTFKNLSPESLNRLSKRYDWY